MLLVFFATGFLCCSVKTYSQANNQLSNLIPPTAVNVDLLPINDYTTNNWINIGSPTKTWGHLYFRGFAFRGSDPIIQINNSNTYLGLNAGDPFESHGSPLPERAYNVGIGYNSMPYAAGGGNTAVGAYTLNSQAYGAAHNVAIGGFALETNNQSDNVAVGYYSLRNISGGAGENVSVGTWAMQNNQYGGGNSVLGHQALMNNNTGNYNTALGHQAMLNNNNGSNNVSIGRQSLLSNNSGQGNTSIGSMSMFYNTVGSNNVAIGSQSIYNNVTGSYNVGIGWAALFNNGNSYNVGVGLQAGYHLTTQGTFLGTYADAVDGSFNVTAIGYGAQTTADNQVKIGNPAVTSIGGYANWTNFSDGRYKKNIQENVPGLEFINQLKPVTYTLDIDGIENALTQRTGATNASLSKVQASSNSGAEVNSVPLRNQTPQDIQAKQQKAKVVYTGFVAQDVEKAAKAVNYDFSGVDVPKSKNDFYGLRYADFVIPLVKAVQELSQKNNELEDRIAKLENMLNQNNISNNVTLSSASISQNEPNPFNSNSIIHYVIPGRFSNARVDFTDNLGKVIKSVSVKSSTGNITVDGSLLSSGTYQYTLVVDGKIIDTKRMAISK